ncbi:hypothetical protein SAMN05443579_107224 [Variovorax sp. PDC80]|uniref:pyridoxamine 5'-phosphate oxidase family protein n=1 Tax=Variovorax sp. PDC80 TaxID=1882827 RepID=UPI0008F16E99|nr:pyridoxamine 5'-phosphate oxidase family protein [Variovorax sp. PDC80]SFO93367.1 hypothetical protein SAMN05443579_107224 [Variovorax sp. PDC80]
MTTSDTLFHEGELMAQRNAGERDIAVRNGATVGRTIIRGALPFVRQQKTAYAASLDPNGQVWASILLGEPGFLAPSDDAAMLSVDLGQVAKLNADPFWENIRHDARIGLLLLELQSRRRLKINGEAHLEGERLEVQVTKSFPICPRYIHRREIVLADAGEATPSSTSSRGNELGPAQLELIADADTFFLASAHATRGADCSHRGGPRGFVRHAGDGVLRIPDYNGNSMFNSFGNFLLNPQAGLTFPDYERRRVLQLAGTVEMMWNQADPQGLTGGTGRFWEFKPSHWIESELPATLQTKFIEFSPFLPSLPEVN